MNPAIAAPQAALTEQRVLRKGRMYPSDRVDHRLDLTRDGLFRRQRSTGEVLVDLPCSLAVPLGGDRQQRRPQLAEAHRGQPAARNEPAAARDDRIGPFDDQRPFPAVDDDADPVHVGLQLLLTGEPDRLPVKCFLQAGLQLPAERDVQLCGGHVGSRTLRLGALHPAICMALPSHSV